MRKRLCHGANRAKARSISSAPRRLERPRDGPAPSSAATPPPPPAGSPGGLELVDSPAGLGRRAPLGLDLPPQRVGLLVQRPQVVAGPHQREREAVAPALDALAVRLPERDR